MTTNSGVYAEVTERVMRALEAGVVPWTKPWSGGQPPMNLVSRRPYRGVNVLILAMSGQSSPYWLTYRQATALGGHVRSGEHGTRIYFWKPLARSAPTSSEQDDEAPRAALVAKAYTVFNASQCVDVDVPATGPEPVAFQPLARTERVLAAVEPTPTIRHAGDRAYFTPATDAITMPSPATFASPDHYYSTLFHELTHWTGHPSRLARPTLKDAARFGDAAYSKEELVAEMGSGFLGALTGIDSAPVQDNQAAYIASWLRALKDDQTLVVGAAAQAQKAVDFLTASGPPGPSSRPCGPPAATEEARA
ncbi:MAG: ArdC family protein [Thermoplasmatota archaeon]